MADDDLSKRIREVRDALGYTQDKMAEATGGKMRSWQDYERGVRTPGAEVLARISALGVDVNWLLTGKGQMFGQPPGPSAIDRQRLVNAIAAVQLLQVGRRKRSAETLAEEIVFAYELGSRAPDPRR